MNSDAPPAFVAAMPAAPAPLTMADFVGSADLPAAPAAPAAPEPAPAAPEPAPATPEPAAAAPAPPAEPAPASNPDALARNWRITAKDQEEQIALSLRKSNPDMSLAEAVVAAREKMGLPSPFAQPDAPAPGTAPAPAAPPAPASPLEEVRTSISTLEEQLADLNPLTDAHQIRELDKQIRAEIRREAELLATAQVQRFVTEQQQMQAAVSAEQASFNAAVQDFPDLANDASSFANLFHTLRMADVKSDSDALASPTYEQELAARVGQLLNISPKSASAAPAPAAPASPTTGTPNPAAPPAQTHRTAQPAAVAPVPGRAAQPSSEHRVTVQPADASIALQQSLAQAGAADDFESLSRALAADLSGGNAPGRQPLFTDISLGGPTLVAA